MFWHYPTNVDNVIDFTKSIGCDYIESVGIFPEPQYRENDCHNNVADYVSNNPGASQVYGYYLVESPLCLQAIYHSVVETIDGSLLDITPYRDNRRKILFAKSIDQQPDYGIGSIYYPLHAKYMKQEDELMYYVYFLKDPRDDNPFYVGKGTGKRAQQHLWDISREHNQYKNNKIASIREAGLEPEIVYVAENIDNEELAYDIERALISHYGRKGYESDGILTNVCLDSRPPNHKGKTYVEIYGSEERAKEEIEKRRQIQLSRGGFGPKKHSKETRKLLSKIQSGSGNGMFGKHHSEETKRKISEANSGKIYGKNNKNSKGYRVISPEKNELILWGGELKEFCDERDFSYATFRAALHYERYTISKGKSMGWRIEYL